jgi:hypothetical protein
MWCWVHSIAPTRSSSERSRWQVVASTVAIVRCCRIRMRWRFEWGPPDRGDAGEARKLITFCPPPQVSSLTWPG